MNIRAIVIQEAKRRGMSGYAIAKAAKLPMRGVQSFLAGEKEMRSDRLGKVLDVLGITLKLPPKKRS